MYPQRIPDRNRVSQIHASNQIAHKSGVFWPRIMPLVAYVDDSGSDLTSPTYVLGGVMLPETTWQLVAEEWNGVLRSDPSVDYFKGSEVWDRGKGPFARLTDNERLNKLYSLVDVIVTYHPAAISIRLNRSDFQRFASTTPLLESCSDPYFFLFYGLIARVGAIGVQEAAFRSVRFIFDNQNQIGERALDWYKIFVARCTERSREVLSGAPPAFADEKKCCELQAADMFAWYRRRDALSALHGVQHQLIWKALERFHYSFVMDPDHFPYVAYDLGITDAVPPPRF